MSVRISLTEASRRAPRILEQGDSLQLDEGAPPTLNDLAGALQFALGDGRIWLNDERMVMIQTQVVGALRARMIASSGMEQTRKDLLRVGWGQGVQLAELITKRFKQDNVTAALAAGPRVHTMEGFAKVVTKRFEFDTAKRQYLGEFYWHDSVEGTEHLHSFGVCDCPTCWLQVGVPSGYTSTLLGFPVIFREVECIGQGAQHCVVIGRDAASWGDDVPELELFGLKGKRNKPSQPWTPSTSVAFKAKKAPRDLGQIVGTSAAIQRAKRLLEKAAVYSEPVLLMGEPGTGKEHFARYLHTCGAAPDAPFVPVNCSAFLGADPSELDTLFGEDGMMVRAEGGTLFLNDVLSLPPNMQARLALKLHDRERHKMPYRIVAATGRNPQEAVKEGKLRTDLQYHLSVLPVLIPPLRDRTGDIPKLIEHFLDLHSSRHVKPLEGLTGRVFDMLLRYDYPGNLRELSNLIERGVIYAESGGKIDINHVFSMIENMPQVATRLEPGTTTGDPTSVAKIHEGWTLEEMEIEAVRAALIDADWNISAAARKLGLTRAKLDYRVKKFDLSPG